MAMHLCRTEPNIFEIAQGQEVGDVFTFLPTQKLIIVTAAVLRMETGCVRVTKRVDEGGKRVNLRRV